LEKEIMIDKKENKLVQKNNAVNQFICKHYIVISLIIIGIIGGIIRFYYLPFEIPLILDALAYFYYATDMVIIDGFPKGHHWPNNGWSTLLYVFFNFFPSDNYFDFMNIQRIVSSCISVLTIIPIFYLCKKFFKENIAIIGAAIFALEPRIIQNSIMGITEPLYIFLGTISLSLFLSDNKKLIYLSFVIAGLFALIRYEGLLLIIPLLIIFTVRFRKEKKIYIKIIFVILIFVLTLLPMAHIRTETLGNDGLVNHLAAVPIFYQGVAEGNDNENMVFKMIINGFYSYVLYFVWVTIPIFFLIIPYGLFKIIKNRDAKKWMLIITGIVLSASAFYAYSRGIQETRYLYVLYPLLCVVSLYTINPIFNKFKDKKLSLSIIIVIVIIITSVTFLEIKIDTEHEKEAYIIAEKITQNAKGVNEYSPESNYLMSTKMYGKKYPALSNSEMNRTKIISTSNYKTLEKFIVENEQVLTHIVIDNKKNRQGFLKNIILNENNYLYLEKEFDSKDLGFEYDVKMFKINYKVFHSIMKQQNNKGD